MALSDETLQEIVSNLTPEERLNKIKIRYYNIKVVIPYFYAN